MRNEMQLALAIVLCAALIGSAVMLRDATITGFAVDNETVNQAPVYTGTAALTTLQAAPLVVDLAQLFSDADGDALTFLVAEEDQVAVTMDGSIATLTPAEGFAGERVLTIVASDGANVVREYVKLVVEGNASVPAEAPLTEETPAPTEEAQFEAAPVNETDENVTVTETPTPAPTEFGTQEFSTQDLVFNESMYFLAPYVVSVNSTAETVRLETLIPTNLTLEYGTTTAYGTFVTNTSFATKHEREIGGLSPNTLYFYRIIVANASDTNFTQNATFNGTFVTSQDTLTTYRFAVLGDSRGNGCGEQGVNFTNIIEQIRQKDVEFIVMVGDDIQAEGCTNTSTNVSWQGFHNITHILRYNKTYFSAIGNHEDPDREEAREAWKNYWVQPLNGDGAAGHWNETTFTWRYGKSLFIFLNTEEPSQNGNISGAQFSWLNNTALNLGGVTHKFVFNHRPLAGSNRSGTLPTDDAVASNIIADMLYSKGVTVGFAGHNHMYCFNTTNNGQMPFITTGGAGSPLQSPGQCAGTLAVQDFNYVIVNVTGANATTQAFNLSGTVLHTYSRVMTQTLEGCATINESTTLTQNISGTGTCVTVGASNTVLDCAGYAIEFDSAGGGADTGITVTNKVNVTIRNCVIIDRNAGGTNGNGIEFNNVSGSAIANVTITTNGTSNNYGVYLLSASRNNTIENSTLRTFGSGSNNYGVELNGVHNNSVRRTTVITNGTANNNGIDIIVAYNNTLETVNISTAGSSSPGIAISISNGTRGNNVTFTNPVNWMSSDTGSFSNFSNTTFWMPNGSIAFRQTFLVNSTSDLTKARLNLTLHRAFLNSTILHYLNTSATIALYEIAFTDPRPNVDFEDDGSFAACNAPQCVEESFANGVFTFNVSSFTTYNGSEGAVPEANFTTITGCAVINGSTKLANNVTGNGTCISFNNHSIFLDCAGFTINYGNDGRLNNSRGINVTNVQNATVSNCTIRRVNQTPMTGSRLSYGIALLNASFARVENNTILTNGTEENTGIHTSGTGSVRVEVVTNNGNVNSPYCSNGTGSTVVSCKTCFTVAGVNCANLGQSACTDGEGFKTDTLASFNISADSIPSQGRITLIGGEAVQCHLNDQRFLSTYARNTCGAFRSADIPGSFFVAGTNNLTCSVSGSGEEEDNGFKLATFSYDIPAVVDRGANLTIRNNTIIAAGGNSTRGIYVDNPYSVLANNTITTNGTNFGHGIYIAAGGQGSLVANNTVSVRPTGSNGILVVGSLNNTFLNNSIVNYTLAAVYLDNALNNTFNQSEIPLFGRRSSLYVLEPDGSLNFTGTLNITNQTNLARVINISFNATRVNASTNEGQQFNISAVLEFFGMPFFGSRPVFDSEDDVSFAACDDPRCVGQSYNLSARIMRFNVSSFTTYAVSELSACGTLDSDFNVSTTTYLLINNVTSTGTCFNIVGNNITLDCAGFAIHYGSGGGSNSIGVNITTAASNQTVINVTVRNCVIAKNGTSGSDSHGISMFSASDVRLFSNNITTRSSRSHAVLIRNSYNTTLANVAMVPEEDAVRVDGTETAQWSTHEINASNTANGLNISYFGGAGTSPACPNNGVLTRPITQHITLVSCTGVTLNDFNSSDRLTVVNSNYTNVSNSNFRNNSRGIAAFFSTHTSVTNNTVSTLRDGGYGVHASHANFTNITFNRIQTDNGSANYGILLEIFSHGSNISNNNITTNGTGDGVGIVVGASTQVIIQSNNITTNGSGSGNKGIKLNSTSESNTVTANSIFTNGSSSSGGIDTNGSNNNITNNVVRTSSADFTNFNFGIGVQNGANNDVSFNDIETSGSGDAANGINVTNVNNSRFVNNTIRATGSDTLRGIWVRVNSNNNLFHNNTIRTEAFFGTPSYGIELNTNASNNSVMGNNISTNGTSSDYGVYVFLSDRTTIAYNTIRTQSGNGGNGIDIDGTAATLFSDYAFIFGNNITAGQGAGSNTGIEIEEARHVIIENNTVLANSSTGCCNVGMDTSSFTFRVNVSGNQFTTMGGTTGSNIGIDMTTSDNASIKHNVITTNGGSSSDGIIYSRSNTTILNNTIYIHAVSSSGIFMGQTTASLTRNQTNFYVDNRIHVNSTTSVGISVLGATFVERHNFNHTVLNVTGTWISAEGGTGTRLQGNFSLNFTNTTFLNENGSIRIPGSFVLNFSRVRINQSNLNITRNRAFLNATNTTYLKNNTNDTLHMNQSAIITLRFLTLGNATPIVDYDDNGQFESCPETNCTDRSYTGGTLTFNVTSFTTYSSADGGIAFTLTKTDLPDPVNASALLNYTIAVSVSLGNASNITLTDTYPSQVIFQTASPGAVSGNNTFVIGNLTAGNAFRVNISVLVNNVSNGTVLSNFANISFQNSTGEMISANVTESTTVSAPSCNVISENITLAQDLFVNGSCIRIGADNVTLDCNGVTIRGNGTGTGVNVTNRHRVTIRNCIIENFSIDLNFANVTNSTAINNTMRITPLAVRAVGVVRSLFENNNASSVSGEALRIESSTNVNLTNNLFASDTGIAVNVMSGGGELSFFDGFEDGTMDPFRSQGNADWTANTSRANTGSFSAMSGNITHSQNSEMVYNITMPGPGTISFARNVSSESGFDFLQFYIDDVLQSEWSGEQGWSVFNFTISSAGYHNFSWYYFKDSSADEGVDAAWVDDINITAPVSGSTNITFIGTTALANGTWVVTGTNNTNVNFANTTFLNASGSITIYNQTTAHPANVTLQRLNISFNRAFLNSTNLTFLNTSARVALNGLTSSDPGATVDLEDDGSFATCTASRCVEDSYAGGVFAYNVTSFTTYSSAETAAGNVNVTISKSDSPDPVNASRFLNYTITLTISSNNASNVTLTDLYPPQVIFLSASPSPTNGNNTFILGNLTQGSTFAVNISVLVNNVTNGTVINNTANISYQNGTGQQLFFNVTESTTVNAVAALACGTTITANTTLTQDLSCTGTGVVIGADNVTFDCAGYTILYDSAGLGRNAISIFNVVNTVVRDCTLIDINASGAAGVGINATNGTGSRLLNNTIQTNGTTNNFGILLRGTIRNATIANNTIRTRGNTTINDGIRLDGLVTASNNLIEGNVITTNGSSSNNGIYLLNSNENSTVRGNVIVTGTSGSQNQGIFLEVRPKNNSIHNNTILTSGTSSNYGIDLTGNNADGSDAVNNRIFNNSVITNGTTNFNDGIVVDRADNNTIIDNTVVAGGPIARDSNGIILYDSVRINLTRNVLTTVGNNSENDGIELSTNDNEILVEYTRINTSGVQSYGVRVLDSNHSRFLHTVLNDTRDWLFANEASANTTFVNTTFATPQGSVRIIGNISMQPFPTNVSRSKLNVTQNRSFMNATNLSFMNVSAQIVLQGISFTDPKPVADFEDDGTFADCAAADCQEVSFAGNVYVFNVSHFTSHAASESAAASTNLTGCAVINQSTNVTQDITGNGTCLIINGSNVDLFCAGGRIFYNALGGDSTYGVFVNGRTNITIRNCIIIDINVSGAFGHGIFLNATNGSTLLNDTVKTNGTSENFGIFLQMSALGNRVLNNTIEAQGSAGANYGIYVLQGSAQNNITGNSVTTNGTTGNYGIHVRNGSDSTLIANNSVRALGDALTNVGINIFNSSRMNITANSIFTNGTLNNFGVVLQFNISGSVVANNVISANGNDTSNIGVYLVQDVGVNNITGNTITTTGSELAMGISLERNATRNLIQGNVITTQGTVTQNHGIRLIDSSFTNVTGNTITTGRSIASTNQGVRAIQSDNVTIAQNTATVSGTGSSAGLTILGNVSGGLMFNNTVTTGNGVFDEGIDILVNTSGVRVIGNVVVANGTTGANGITIEVDATGTIVANNTITSTGNTTSFGIWLQSNGSNSQLINNTITTGGSVNNHGIRIEAGSNNNTIIGSNITVTANASYGVSIQQANDTSFINTRLVSTEWIVTGADTVNNFTNTTFLMPAGAITVTGLAQAIGAQNVTRAKLNITLNRSFMNSTNLTFLNVTGQVLLRSITLTDPKPVIDTEDDGTFADCAVADCQELSYTNSTYVFNVTHFTSHAAGENSSTPPPPPPPAPGGGGGGGGSGSRSFSGITGPSVVAPAQEAVAPEVQQPLACAEDWECQDWSPCADGTQSRTCTDRSECGTRTSRPLLSQSCVPERTPTPEAPLAQLVPKSIRYAPQLRPCMALALGIDAVLVIIAVILLLVLANHARKRESSTLLIALDTLLAIALALVLAQRSACDELLPLQYAAFVILALAAVLIHLFRQLGRRDGSIAPAPRASKPQKLPKPAPVKSLPAQKKVPIAVPAPPAPPKKQVILLERSEPAAIARLRAGPSVWQRLAEVTQNALKPKPKVPHVPEVKQVKGFGRGSAELPKSLRRTLDTTFRKAKVTDIPDLRDEFSALAAGEDLLKSFNKSVKKVRKK